MRLANLKWVHIGYFGLVCLGLAALQRSWVHPSGAHSHRQADTIGMMLASAQAVKDQGLEGMAFLWKPIILQRGLLDGVNASEFPLLSLIGLPGFLLAPTPQWGVVLATFFVFLLNLLCFTLALPGIFQRWGFKTNRHEALLIAMASTLVGNQAGLLMPEGVALPLAVLSIRALLDSRSLYFWLGTLIGGIALCVKPTAIICYALLIATPDYLLNLFRRNKLRLVLGAALTLFFPYFWYSVHSKSLSAVPHGPQIFALATLSPLSRLHEIGGIGVLRLFHREIFEDIFPHWTGWAFLALAFFAKRTLLLGSALALALLGAMALDGAHIWVHNYYFIGVTPLAMLIMASVVSAPRRWVRGLGQVLIVWGILYNLRVHVWIWARDSQLWAQDPWKAGEWAAKLIPPNFHPIADDGDYPQKLLSLARTGSITGQSVYVFCKDPKYKGLDLALLTSEAPPTHGALCDSPKSIVKIHFSSAFGWHLSLIASPKIENNK